MKTILTLVVSPLFLMAFAAGVFGATTPTTPHTITVDGDLSDFIRPTEAVIADPSNDSKISGSEIDTIFCTWDASSLYIGVKYRVPAGGDVVVYLDILEGTGIYDATSFNTWNRRILMMPSAPNFFSTDLMIGRAGTQSAAQVMVRKIDNDGITTDIAGSCIKGVSGAAGGPLTLEVALPWAALYGSIPDSCRIRLMAATTSGVDTKTGDIAPGDTAIPYGYDFYDEIPGCYTMSLDQNADLMFDSLAFPSNTENRIGMARADTNNDFLADRAGLTTAVLGIVTARLFGADSGYFLEDATGGIRVRGPDIPTVGQRWAVLGTISQTAGETCLEASYYNYFSSAPLYPRTARQIPANSLADSLEGRLVRIDSLGIVDIGAWPASHASGLVKAAKGNDTVTIYIDSATNLDGSTVPQGLFHLTGIVRQNDVSAPYSSGYYMQPRSTSDILFVPPAAPLLAAPAHGAVINADSILLLWSKGTSDAIKYGLEVATDSQMTNIVLSDTALVDTSRMARSLTDKTTYWWRVRAENIAGWGSYSEVRKFTVTLLGTGISKAALPECFSFAFTGMTSSGANIRYGIPVASDVSLRLYDIRGKRIRSFCGSRQAPGYYGIRVDLSAYAKGCYIMDFKANSFRSKKRIFSF